MKPSLILKQFAALFIKNSLSYLRNWKLFVFFLIFPFLSVLIIGLAHVLGNELDKWVKSLTPPPPPTPVIYNNTLVRVDLFDQFLSSIGTGASTMYPTRVYLNSSVQQIIAYAPKNEHGLLEVWTGYPTNTSTSQLQTDQILGAITISDSNSISSHYIGPSIFSSLETLTSTYVSTAGAHLLQNYVSNLLIKYYSSSNQSFVKTSFATFDPSEGQTFITFSDPLMFEKVYSFGLIVAFQMVLLLPVGALASVIITDLRSPIFPFLKLNGLNTAVYYISQLGFIFSLLTYSYIIVFVFLYIFQLPMILQSSFMFLFIYFVMSLLLMNAYTLFIGMVLRVKPIIAVLLGVLLALLSPVAGTVIDVLFFDFAANSSPSAIPWYVFLVMIPFPSLSMHYTFSHGIYSRCFYEGCTTIKDFATWNHFWLGFILMAINILWLSTAIVLRESFAWLVHLISRKVKQHRKLPPIVTHATMDSVWNEDSSVQKERERVQHMRLDSSHLETLVLDGVTKKFGSQIAVNQISLSVDGGQEGIIFGLLGPNGSGKSTTFGLISGLLSPTKGDIFIHGHSIHHQPILARSKLGYCPQQEMVWSDISVKEHLIIYCLLKHVPLSEISKHVNQVLELVELKDHQRKLAKQLSGGLRKRLAIGISLIGDPQIILLDEITVALDVHSKANVMSILRKIQPGKVLVYTTHYLEEVEMLCSKIAIIGKGNLLYIGSIEELKQKYNQGYRLALVVNDSQIEQVEKQMALICPPQSILFEKSFGKLTWLFPGLGLEHFKGVIDWIEAELQQENETIKDYMISPTNLDDIFEQMVQTIQ